MDVEGILFKSYSAEVEPNLNEVLPPDTLFHKKGPVNVANDLVHNILVDSTLVARRIQLERKYRAIKEGRITDGNPDFIGTWSVRIPVQGLFEIYIKKRKGTRISGIMEDSCGTATVEGEITDTRMWFVKRYDADAVSIGGFPHLRYEGERQNGTIKGTYYSEEYGEYEFEITEQG